ncbi:nucleoside deaminase [Maribacter aestuarii]|uniref:nucleoside deaminase n=1 Tax=Maribacter aestuarii TaxID=1130723 RepID=UPI00248B11BF|nr:nucleoside deaminase [Maribacter aestuarii]
MDNDHQYFMQRAIVLAKQGKNSGNGAFGAVVVMDGEIIAESHNTVNESTDCTQHAELAAIQKACSTLQNKDLGQCILYTSCEPCMMCLGACYWANFKTIYYGASSKDAKDFGYIYSEMYYASEENKRREEFKLKQLLRDEAVAVWKD